MLRSSLLLAVVLLQACTQWQYELGAPLAAYSSPAKAEERPTLVQVMAELGPPLRLSATESGYVMAWDHWRITENSIGFSLGAMGADFLSIDWGEATVDGEFMLLTFDSDHMLSGATLSEWSGDLGGGSAIQPFVGVVDLVDVNDLVNALPQHGWGASYLLPLPEALNARSRPDMGNTGIQQRGTPTGIGQQTLEME